jgi:hypothetical protein
MIQARTLIMVEDRDDLATKLLQLGNELKPITRRECRRSSRSENPARSHHGGIEKQFGWS